MHDHAGAGGADLPLVVEVAHRDPRQRRVEVGIREDQLRGLAAEFECHLAELLPRQRGDGLAHGRAAGEGDLVDALVRCECRAGLGTETGHDVERPVGHARLGEQIGESQRRQRRILGGLDDHRAARGESGSDLPRRDDGGVVPGGDRPDHAEGLAQGESEAVLRTHIGQDHRLTGDLVRPPGIVPERRRGGGDVPGDGVGVELAHLRRLEGGEFRCVLFDEVCGTGEDPATFGAGHARPRTGLEGHPGRLDGGVDIGRTARGDLRDDLFGCRIDRREVRTRSRRDRLPTDAQLRVGDDDGCRGGQFGHHDSWGVGGVKRRVRPDHDES